MNADAIDRYKDIMISCVASFPASVPPVSSLARALCKLGPEMDIINVGGVPLVRWAKDQAKYLRAMMSYVRRVARKNGKGARRAPLQAHGSCK